MLTSGCAMSSNFELMLLNRVDEEAKKTLASISLGRDFVIRHPKIANRFIMRFVKRFESGYVEKAFTLLDFVIFSPYPGKLHTIRECMSNDIIADPHDFQ